MIENECVSETVFFNQRDFRKYIYLVLAAFSESILRYTEIALGKLPGGSILSPMFIPCLFTILIIINITPSITYQIRKNDIAFIALYYTVMALSFLIFPENRIFMAEQKSTIIFIVPLYYLLGIIFCNDTKTIDALMFLSKVIILVSISYIVYASITGQIIEEDAMGRAYAILPSVMYLLLQSFRRKKIIDIIWAIVSFIFLISCGTRGPVVVALFYLCYLMIFRNNSRKSLKVVGFLLVLGFVVAFELGIFDMFLSSISMYLEKLGLSSRVFDYYFNDALISDSSGRDRIFDRAIEYIKANPFGYGVLGEYKFFGWNPHNIYLQIFLHFGVLFGLIIIIVSFCKVIKALKNNPNKIAIDVIVLWIGITFIRGFFGGSYLSYYYSFLMGVCVHEIRNKRFLYPKIQQYD